MSKRRGNDFYCLRSVSFVSETRADEENNDGKTLFGYAAVFDSDTEINSWEGTFTERISKGAFKKTLRERTPVMQFDHGYDARTGTVPIGVYEDIREDDKGLYVEGRLFDNPVVEPIRQAIEGGALDGMSFRFQVVKDEWRDKDGKKIKADELWELLWSPGERGPLQRTIKEVKLSEAGPVVFPAYGNTSVGVRADEPEDLSTLPEEERRKVVTESYLRRMPEPETTPEAAPKSTPEETPPVAAVRTDTSKGHKKERVIPARKSPAKRTIPVRTQRKERVPMSKTIEEMRERLEKIVERMNEIADEYRDEENADELRDFSDEHDKEFETLQAEHTDLTTKVTRAEKRIEFLRDKAKNEPKTVQGAGPAVHTRKTDEDLYSLDRVRMNCNGSLERFVDLCRDNARRIAEDMKYPGIERSKRSDARDQVVDLIETYDNKHGDLSQRIMRTGSEAYARAFGKMVIAQSTAILDPDEARALAIGADATGGFMVPPELDPTIVLTDTVPITPIRRLARVEKISGTKWQGITSAGVTVSRDAEAEEVSDDSPTLARNEVGISRVAGFIPFSFEADMDWPGLQREMRRMLDRAKAKEEGTSFLLGTGVGLNPQGLLTGATQTVLTAGAFSSAHIYAMENALADEFLENAVWLGNKAVYNTVRQFATTDGHSLWERIGAGQPQQLLGYDTYTASGMTSDVATATGKLLLLGDVEEAFIIIDRIGMSVDLIPHLFGPNGRPTGQRGLHAIWRNGSKVLRPEAVRVLVKS